MVAQIFVNFFGTEMDYLNVNTIIQKSRETRYLSRTNLLNQYISLCVLTNCRTFLLSTFHFQIFTKTALNGVKSMCSVQSNYNNSYYIIIDYITEFLASKKKLHTCEKY